MVTRLAFIKRYRNNFLAISFDHAYKSYQKVPNCMILRVLYCILYISKNIKMKYGLIGFVTTSDYCGVHHFRSLDLFLWSLRTFIVYMYCINATRTSRLGPLRWGDEKIFNFSFIQGTAWWGWNLIEKISPRIAECRFGYLKACSSIIYSQQNPKT